MKTFDPSSTLASTLILGSASSVDGDLESLKTQAAYRKATRKMMLAAAACLKLASEFKFLHDRKTTAAMGLVLNSGFGELESTGGFLQAFQESGMARPLLFQNSLHNSTTGFLAIQFGIQGPVLTINHRAHGGEQAFDAASVLLANGDCEACLVVSVETVPPEFDSGNGVGLEGASVLLLSNADFSSAHGLKPKFRACDLPFEKLRESSVSRETIALRSVFDIDFIHRVAGL